MSLKVRKQENDLLGLGLQFHKFGLLFLVKVSRKLRLFWKRSFYDTEATTGAQVLGVVGGCNTQETHRLSFLTRV